MPLGIFYLQLIPWSGTRDHDSLADSLSRRSSSDIGHRDWDAERRKGRSLKVWKRPVVRQYLHKGLIWRSSELQEVASYELFVDLLYVGIIAIIGDECAEDPTGFGLLKFIIVFSIGWKIWTDIQIITSWLGEQKHGSPSKSWMLISSRNR